MKKPKVNLSGEAVKNFFTYHVEKLILGVVVLLVGLFVMWGYQLEGYTAYTPDQMKNNTAEARRNMTDETVWEKIKQDTERDPADSEERMNKGLGENEDGVLPDIPARGVFDPKIAANLPLFAPNAKRGDPEIFSAMEVEVTAGYGPLAVPNRQAGTAAGVDPLAGLDDLMKAATQYQMQKEEEAAAEAEQQARSNRDREDDYGEGGLLPPRGGELGLRNNEIPLTEEQQEAIEGYLAQGTEKPVGVNYVAITALAPYKKQWDEYEAVLKDSAGYDLGRDIPQYVQFVVERAEVAADGSLSPWTAVGWNTKARSDEQRYYAGMATDLIDPRYTDPQLTMAVPPVMLRDLTDLSKHSKTPLISLQEEEAMVDEGTPFKPGETDPDGPGAIGIPNDFSRGGRGEGGRSSYSGDQYSRGGYEGEGGRGGFVEGQLEEQELVDYKLVRYFDFTAQPGKKYQYRVQLWVTDPNHPQDPSLAPPPSLLQEEVIARTVALDRAQGQSARVFYRKTQWSEPSQTISIPKTSHMLAGEMKPTKLIRIRISSAEEASFKMPGEEPKARLMTIAWDTKYAADIPGELDIFRGSTLNFETDVNVLHPPTRKVVTLPKYKFSTNSMVLDMRGGEPLPGSDRNEPLLSPTEVLIIDREGNMIVRNELDDMRNFRLNDYEMPPVPETPKVDEGLEPGRDGGLLFGGEGEGPRRPPNRRNRGG